MSEAVATSSQAGEIELEKKLEVDKDVEMQNKNAEVDIENTQPCSETDNAVTTQEKPELESGNKLETGEDVEMQNKGSKTENTPYSENVNAVPTQENAESKSESDNVFKKPPPLSRDSSMELSDSGSSTLSRQSSDFSLILETLPAELILHICSFLDAKFVITTFSRICSYFHSMLNDDRFWKIRIGKRWPKKYPAIPG